MKRLPTPIPRWLALLSGGVGALVLGACALIVVRHLQDRYLVSHVHGAWMALSEHAYRIGTLYPPLEADGYYGGTRVGPLALLWNAAFRVLGGDVLLGVKLAGLFGGVLALGTTFAVQRANRVPLPLAILLIAGIPATLGGYEGVVSPFRGDTIPIVPQLIALWLVEHKERSNTNIALAALLCVVAFFLKITSGAAVLAIGLTLLLEERKRLPLFCIVWFGAVGLFGWFANWATDGGYVLNVFGLGSSNLGNLRALFGTPRALLYMLLTGSRYVWLAIPAALFALTIAARTRRVSAYVLAWFASIGILLIMLTDSGVSHNHLFELTVLSAIVFGLLWVRFSSTDSLFASGLAALVVWAVIADFEENILNPARDAVFKTEAAWTTRPLEGLVPDGAHVFSEDPSWVVLSGRRPLAIDPWMLPLARKQNPRIMDELGERIESQEFDYVVTLEDLRGEHHNTLAFREHYGVPFRDAITGNYEFVAERFGYFVWRAQRRRAGNEHD